VQLIVVSDASPIRALNHLSLLGLFHELYGSVLVPATVQAELLRPTKTCPAIDITGLPGIEIRRPVSAPAALGIPLDLDPGETEAIALAIELHANLLLMDERKGTEAARKLGLTTIGVLGMLLDAKHRGLIPAYYPTSINWVPN
jgi:hypothetical protein